MTIHASMRLAALSVLAVMSATALARAEGPSVERSWTGAYVGAGLDVGYLSTDQYSPPQQGYGGYEAAAYAGWHPYPSLQAGFDLQLDQAVLGLRLQHSVTNSDGDSFMKVDELVSSNATALTSLSARAGYLFQSQLLGYVSAGVVAGQFNYGSVDERWGLVADSVDAIRNGWSIGAGLEHRLTDTVSVFTEYTHVQFQTASTSFDYGPDALPPGWTYDCTHTLGTVQAGLNFRF